MSASGPVGDAPSRVAGCRLWRLPSFRETRGELTVAEFGGHFPFAVQRMFFVHAVPQDQVRGDHAHRTTAQLLLALGGEVTVVVDDGAVRDEICLNDPSLGLLIPPGVWSLQQRFAPGTVLAVFCSEKYDPQEYIRDYREFLEHVGRGRRG